MDFAISGTRQVRNDFPLIRVQVKSWSVPRESDGSWRYRGLTEKQFNALAGDRRIWCYLILVVVPSDVGSYAYAGDDCLRLSRAAYWVSLRDHNLIKDPSSERKVQVLVPRQNLLTVEKLTSLCEDSGLPGRRV